MFEITTIEPIRRSDESEGIFFLLIYVLIFYYSILSWIIKTDNKRQSNAESYDECLKLKGQMLYVKEWDAIIYLAGPV